MTTLTLECNKTNDLVSCQFVQSTDNDTTSNVLLFANQNQIGLMQDYTGNLNTVCFSGIVYSIPVCDQYLFNGNQYDSAAAIVEQIAILIGYSF